MRGQSLHPDKGNRINSRKVRAKLSLYRQADDETLLPYIKDGEQFIGQRGMQKQRKGICPDSHDIRVRAAKTETRQRYPAGLDEGYPTNLRHIPLSGKYPGLAGVQSGLRSRTDLSLLVTRNGKVVGHTGAFRKGKASTRTKGQASAHDRRRVQIPYGLDRSQIQSFTAKNFIDSLATGEKIIRSGELSGAVPNISNAPIENGIGPQRVAFAHESNERREGVKRRQSSLESERGLPRSSSPERTRINSDGSGGDYYKGRGSLRASSPVPFFRGKNDDEKTANEAAWVTQYLRR